jgi:hypothetical protein
LAESTSGITHFTPTEESITHFIGVSKLMKGGDGDVEEAMSAANLLAETIQGRSRTPHVI